MKPFDNKPPKRPYHRPRLLVYGDLRTLTQGVGNNKNDDNGKKAMGGNNGS
jgi:hypothetical protein